jgi:hypothetical protein
VFDYKQFKIRDTLGAKVKANGLLSSIQAQLWREVGTLILMAIEPVGVPCKRTAVFFLFVFSVVVAASSLSAGQVAARWDFFGGYSYLRFDSPTVGYANWSNLNGFNGEITFNFTPKLGLTADGNGNYGNQLTVYNYMAGPQYALRKDKSAFYAHGLFGKAQNTVNILTATRNGFTSVGRAFAVGGGYDRDLTPMLTFRVQADYLNTQTFGATQNDIRVSTGIVFHHGHIGRRPKL